LSELKEAAIPDRTVEVTSGNRVYTIRLIPIRLEDGKRGFLEIIDDRSLSVQVQSHLKEIKRLNSIIAFARTIGHELNQPLTGISGYCALIKEEVDQSGSVYQDIAEIERQAVRLERIVNKFQSVTHLDYKEHKQ
jgi:signal transduction histidine kinase